MLNFADDEFALEYFDQSMGPAQYINLGAEGNPSSLEFETLDAISAKEKRRLSKGHRRVQSEPPDMAFLFNDEVEMTDALADEFNEKTPRSRVGSSGDYTQRPQLTSADLQMQLLKGISSGSVEWDESLVQDSEGVTTAKMDLGSAPAASEVFGSLQSLPSAGSDQMDTMADGPSPSAVYVAGLPIGLHQGGASGAAQRNFADGNAMVDAQNGQQLPPQQFRAAGPSQQGLQGRIYGGGGVSAAAQPSMDSPMRRVHTAPNMAALPQQEGGQRDYLRREAPARKANSKAKGKGGSGAKARVRKKPGNDRIGAFATHNQYADRAVSMEEEMGQQPWQQSVKGKFAQEEIDASDSGGSNKHRGRYKCGKCGQPKANHVCPFGAPPARSASTQVDLRVTKDGIGAKGVPKERVVGVNPNNQWAAVDYPDAPSETAGPAMPRPPAAAMGSGADSSTSSFVSAFVSPPF